MIKKRLAFRPKQPKSFKRRESPLEKKLVTANTHKGTLAGKVVVVKVIDLSDKSEDYKNKFLPRELDAIGKIIHPNIKTHGVIRDSNKVYIVMDLAEKGDLLEIMHLKDGPIIELAAIAIFRGVVSALNYMHGKGFTHRDIKTENILINSHDIALIADFGFAREIGVDSKVLSATGCGSRPYLAPEIFTAIEYDPIASDVWSCGIVLFTMLMYRMPFPAEESLEFVRSQKMRMFEVDDTISSQGKDLIEQILEPDPLKRITTGQILSHPWLK